jgi:hypothetical protein
VRQRRRQSVSAQAYLVVSRAAPGGNVTAHATALVYFSGILTSKYGDVRCIWSFNTFTKILYFTIMKSF